MKEMGERVAKMPASFRILAKHGWYICGSSAMFDSLRLADQINAGELDSAEDFLIEFYESEMESIIRRCSREHPERTNILKEAEQAHQKEMFYASTLLFLANADGILKGNLFILKKGKDDLKTYLKSNGHTSEFSQLIIDVSTIDKFVAANKFDKSFLNRHMVMHGHDSQYGTKKNSLKALSLLAYVSDFFSPDPDHP